MTETDIEQKSTITTQNLEEKKNTIIIDEMN